MHLVSEPTQNLQPVPLAASDSSELFRTDTPISASAINASKKQKNSSMQACLWRLVCTTFITRDVFASFIQDCCHAPATPNHSGCDRFRDADRAWPCCQLWPPCLYSHSRPHDICRPCSGDLFPRSYPQSIDWSSHDPVLPAAGDCDADRRSPLSCHSIVI